MAGLRSNHRGGTAQVELREIGFAGSSDRVRDGSGDPDAGFTETLKRIVATPNISSAD